jgi:hypothetical protein
VAIKKAELIATSKTSNFAVIFGFGNVQQTGI